VLSRELVSTDIDARKSAEDLFVCELLKDRVCNIRFFISNAVSKG
jgi:hypothetical protein